MTFVVDKAIPFAGSMFAGQAEVVLADGHAVTPALVRHADALIVRSVTRVDEALLGGSAVRFVGTATIGCDHVDTAWLSRRGIAFASAPGSNANSVAEYVVAALLVLAARGIWAPPPGSPPGGGEALRGLTLGVVGAGNVGSKVIRKAQALGMRVVVNDPPLERSGAPGPFVPLGELLGSADIVSLHVPLTKEGEFATAHLFGDRNIGRIKEGVVFFNTSRGGVVETAALKRAIAAGRLRAVVLDVWEGEPAIDPELLAAVSIGTPHIAGYSTDGKVNGAMMMYDAACRHFGFARLFTAAGRLPAPEHEVIEAHGAAGREIEELAAIVRLAYPIERDDALLRGMLALPREKQGAFFRGLRGTYPVRREFAATTVAAPEGALAGMLAGLGFARTFQYIQS